jgi:putative SOS response-associated peptidase YedK
MFPIGLSPDLAPRCLIPADGFYEWRTIGGMKIPFSIGMKDGNGAG